MQIRSRIAMARVISKLVLQQKVFALVQECEQTGHASWQFESRGNSKCELHVDTLETTPLLSILSSNRAGPLWAMSLQAIIDDQWDQLWTMVNYLRVNFSLHFSLMAGIEEMTEDNRALSRALKASLVLLAMLL